MGQQVLGSDKILRMNNFHLLGMVQSHDTQASLNPEEVFELGRTSKVDTSYELETSGSFELISIGNTAGLLARMTPKRDGAGAFTGFFYSGNSNKNNYLWTEGDLVESQFDLVEYVRPDQTRFTEAFWYPRCFLTQLQGRADSNGNATETYNWAGQFFAAFETPYHDIIASPCTVGSSTTLSVIDTTANSSSYTLVYVYVDEKRFSNSTVSEATKFSHSGTTLTVVTTEGYTIPANAIARAVFYKTASPSTTFPSLSNTDRGSSAFYVKGYQVNIYIAPADPSAPLASDQWLRVQSVEYTIDLQSEQLRQLSYNHEGSSIYCRVPTLPFQISVSASAYESDFTAWKKIMTNAQDGSSVYANVLSFSPSQIKGDPTNPLAVVVRYYTKAGALLQDLRFTDLTLDQPSQRIAVRGRSELTWTFRGTAFTLIGYNA